MSNPYSRVAKTLEEGGVGLLPSDTIYGLSCAALNEKAVQRVYELKGRDYNKPCIILLCDVEQAKLLRLKPKVLQPAARYWPAPLTVIAPAGKSTPKYLHRGISTLAVRVPDNAELRALIKRVGPLISTSANIQGKEPAKTVAEAKKYFGGKLDFYIDAGEVKDQPSTLAKIENARLKIIRHGAFKIT